MILTKVDWVSGFGGSHRKMADFEREWYQLSLVFCKGDIRKKSYGSGALEGHQVGSEWTMGFCRLLSFGKWLKE